jgi:hypothetical protein
MAFVFIEMGDLEQAQLMYEQVLEITKKVYGENYNDCAECEYLGRILSTLGK